MSAGDRRCPACGATVQGRFCASCGTAVASGGAGPWIYLGGGLVLGAVFALGVLVGRGSGVRGAEAVPPVASAGAPAGPAPDISGLSPRERFDRLYARVMQASSGGDAATVERFAPMAIAAYGMLDSVDVGARFDVAVIKLHVGDIDGARALADTMVRTAPTHLFGYMIRATVARFTGDSAGARIAGELFLRNYAGEIGHHRPEYATHASSIDAFKRQLERAR
jgi:hypothetical protein